MYIYTLFGGIYGNITKKKKKMILSPIIENF